MDTDAPAAARRLLGADLIHIVGGRQLRGRIVETEAYDQTDAASHSYRGRTPRTDVMFGPPGRLYVYFTYGMHYCCNVVSGPAGYGSAVLIRAVEVEDGEEYLSQNRGGRTGVELTNGPAKVCQAFLISKPLNGHDLRHPPLRIELCSPLSNEQIVRAPRIGITRAMDVPWRFYIRGNAYVSKTH